ncbi:MAG: phenylalanine--tRNA ligase subunit alpha, partial [Candidatus Eisenbacteria bacterium]
MELLRERPEEKALVNDALARADGCRTLSDVEDARVALLGKKGSVSGVFKRIGEAPPEERPALGEIGNLLRKAVEEGLREKAAALSEGEMAEKLSRDAIDVTLPGRKMPTGHRHLLTRVEDEVISIFLSLGYSVETGPEVELDYYNFEALNTPVYHPARSLQDTFYIERGDPSEDDPRDLLLRTHTSPVQVRVMEKRPPPLYVISPGRAYRKDEIDATHSAMFTQVEGFAVDEDITMG